MLRILLHPISLFLLTVAAGAFYLSLVRTNQNLRTSTEALSVLDQEVAQIASEVEKLESQVAEATSAATKERILRDELLMQKPGEYVLKLPAIETSKQDEEAVANQTPWQQWKEILYISAIVRPVK